MYASWEREIGPRPLHIAPHSHSLSRTEPFKMQPLILWMQKRGARCTYVWCNEMKLKIELGASERDLDYCLKRIAVVLPFKICLIRKRFFFTEYNFLNILLSEKIAKKSVHFHQTWMWESSILSSIAW